MRKLNDERPYQTAEFALTVQDVYMLRTSVVPDAVDALLDKRLTFKQQTPRSRVMATLYVERHVPVLKRAENHWAALCLLFKHTSTVKATRNRVEKRRAIAKAKADKRRTDRQHAIDQELHGVPVGPEADALLALMEHGDI